MRFWDIRNFQGRGKRYKPSQSPKLITLTETFIIPDITKSESNNCFLINCFEKKKKTQIHRCTEPIWHCSWKSCIARATYRLVSNLLADNLLIWTGGHFVCACVNIVCWSATEAFSVNCLRSLRAFAGCFLELNNVYWELRSTNVLFKVSRYFADESEFIVASLLPLRGQSLLS